MKKIFIALVILYIGVFLGGGPASAAFTEILPGLETPLAEAGGILDTLYGLGNLQRDDDDSGQEQVWFPANGSATATAKFAAFTQEFGYIPDVNKDGFFNDPFVSLFTIPGGTNGIGLGGPSATLNSGNVGFLWALDPSDSAMWTSLESKNDDGFDHMVTWLITGNDGKPNNSIGSRVIAWEDLRNGGDQDYNDLVVEVSVAPVPIPAGILLLGSGLLGLLGIRKKFKL